MKRKLCKKLLAMSLCISMAIVAAGCGQDGGSGSSQPESKQEESKKESTASKTEESSAVGEEQGGGEETPEYDFGGRVVRIGAYYDATPNPDNSLKEQALAERTKFVEENYNCTVEYVKIDGDYVAQYITSVLAGDPICDIGYVINNRMVPALIEGGIAYPLDDLLDVNTYKWRSDVTESGFYKGKHYLLLLKNAEVRYGVFWNKTLFDKYGLPDLYKLVENDEWTWEKFEEVANLGNKDLDGDGVIDIYGLNVREELPYDFIYSNGASIVNKTDAGIEMNLDDPRIIEALTGLQHFNENVEYRDSIDWSKEGWDSFIKDFRDGKYMMHVEGSWVANSYFIKDDGTGMQDEFGWVPFPKGPSAENYVSYGQEMGCWFLLNGVDAPEDVMKIYDLITDIGTDEEIDMYVDDELELKYADDAKSVELMGMIHSDNLGFLNPINGFDTLRNAFNDMFNSVAKGESTPQTAIDANRSKIEAALTDISTHDYKKDMENQKTSYLQDKAKSLYKGSEEEAPKAVEDILKELQEEAPEVTIDQVNEWIAEALRGKGKDLYKSQHKELVEAEKTVDDIDLAKIAEDVKAEYTLAEHVTADEVGTWVDGWMAKAKEQADGGAEVSAIAKDLGFDEVTVEQWAAKGYTR